jgi:hypothetical protein
VYGKWDDWDDPETQRQEKELAETHNLKWSQRGPLPPHKGGPTLWMNLPYNQEKGCWGYTNRWQLPACYAFPDWWSNGALEAEGKMAVEYHIPWNLRGPPTGPVDGSPQLWRGMIWRGKACKWMSRGGKNLETRKAKYGAAAKACAKSDDR